VTKEDTKLLRIFVYGADTMGYRTPGKPVQGNSFILEFESVNTKQSLADYDGVIFMCSLFEHNTSGVIQCDNRPEMIKRSKQILSLVGKGGFVCILFFKIVDSYTTGHGYSHSTYTCDDTSLGKLILNDIALDSQCRKSSNDAFRHFHVVRAEFEGFVTDYGSTHNYFTFPYQYKYPHKTICEVGDHPVGVIVLDKVFLLPCLAVDKDEESTIRLFDKVAYAIAITLPKLRRDIPEWLDKALVFPNERKIIEEIRKEQEILEKLKSRCETYRRFKECLVFSSDKLVDSVCYVFEIFFGFAMKKNEQFVEDFQLCSKKDGSTVAIVEVKGTNTGVKGEHINQLDTHRERLELPGIFPAILIANVKMNASTLIDKDLIIAPDQIKKAVNNNVLIIRTLDLLNLIILHENGLVSSEEFQEVLLTKSGWLRVDSSGYKVEVGDTEEQL
jgi:hypothetical protein